jgi:hypothetical protein
LGHPNHRRCQVERIGLKLRDRSEVVQTTVLSFVVAPGVVANVAAAPLFLVV